MFSSKNHNLKSVILPTFQPKCTTKTTQQHARQRSELNAHANESRFAVEWVPVTLYWACKGAAGVDGVRKPMACVARASARFRLCFGRVEPGNRGAGPVRVAAVAYPLTTIVHVHVQQIPRCWLYE